MDDTKQGRLGFRGESSEVCRDIHSELDGASFLEAFRVPADRGSQAGLVEQGRMQEIGKRSNLFADLAGSFAAFFEDALGLRFVERV